MTLMQLEEEEPARAVISIDSLLSPFKQPATILQLQLGSFSGLLAARSHYGINLLNFVKENKTKTKETAVFLSPKDS